MYRSHPSAALNRAFAARPFQGAEPEKATFLFVGLDANYGEDIEANAIFPRLLEYLGDGVEFWKVHRVHHPFLLPEYREDGRYYHRTFADIGFAPEHAEQVSFIEMLHVPTVGQSKLAVSDLDKDHLARLHGAIEGGDARHIFVSPNVAKLMRESSVFPWMPKTPIDADGPLKIWRKTKSKTIYWHHHFSYWGRPQKAEQLKAIRQLLTVPA